MKKYSGLNLDCKTLVSLTQPSPLTGRVCADEKWPDAVFVVSLPPRLLSSFLSHASSQEAPWAYLHPLPILESKTRSLFHQDRERAAALLRLAAGASETPGQKEILSRRTQEEGNLSGP